MLLLLLLLLQYGIKQVADDLARGCDTAAGDTCATGGKVVSAIFGIIVASSQLGHMSPAMTALGLARTSAVSVFETIDRVPVIDSASDAGLKPDSAHGELHIDNIGFSYPARQDDTVYTNVNIKVSYGETLALVSLCVTLLLYNSQTLVNSCAYM
jgi:ABC-type multidrug transport system fused ATPase/permease subunit